MGYESSSIIKNMGFLFVVMTGGILAIIFTIVIRLIFYRIPILKRIYQKMSSILFFNPILRTILESYLEFAIIAMINLYNVKFEHIQDQISAIVSIGMVSILLLAPGFIFIFCWCN